MTILMIVCTFGTILAFKQTLWFTDNSLRVPAEGIHFSCVQINITRWSRLTFFYYYFNKSSQGHPPKPVFTSFE